MDIFLRDLLQRIPDRFVETLELPWPRKQIARFLNLLEAYAQENNVNY